MSLTIQQQPDIWTPAYNPMVFVLDSNNNAQTGFRYVADIYVSGTTGRVLRMLASPSPTLSQGVFDVSGIIQTFLGELEDSLDGFNINKTTNGFGLAASSMLAYEVKFGEQYGAPSAVTTYPNITVTGTKYTFNGAYDTATWSGYDFTNFDGTFIAIEDTIQMLNRMPLTTTYQSNENNERYLHYIVNTVDYVYDAKITTFDIDGNVISTGEISNPYASLVLYAYRRQYFNCGVRSLNAATYSTGSITIDDSVYSYQVYFRDISGNTVSQVYTFEMDKRCYAGRTPLDLHWLNDQGAFDSKQFTMINRPKTAKTVSTFKRKLGIESNNAYGYATSDAGTVVLDTTLQERYELQSDWTNIDESQMLNQLIQSPVVFLEVNFRLLRGRIISPTESELKAVAFGNIELDNLKIVFEASVDSKRQRA